MSTGRFFYGWWIVAAGFGLEMLIGALMFHAYGAYVVLLREEFGWSKTLLSAGFAMARAESGILGPVQGWLTDRFGPRALIRAGMLIFGLGFLLFSQITSPLAFFATFFMMALGSSLGGYLPIGVAIAGWFERRRALAFSISSTGMAVGGLLTPLIVLVLRGFGWRWTAFFSGVLILLVGVPIAQIVRHRPEPYGWRRDGDPLDAPGRIPAARDVHDFSAREAIREPAFWYIALGHGSALLVVSAVLVHLIIHVTERLGYSLQQASTVVAVLTVMQITGQLTGGWGRRSIQQAGDRRGLHDRSRDGDAAAGLGHGLLDARGLRRAARPLLGGAGPDDGGHPGGLLRGGLLRHHHRLFVDGGDAGHDRRPARRRYPRRSYGQLRDGVPGDRRGGGPGLDLLLAGQASGAAGDRGEPRLWCAATMTT